jgi:hypothetical protein
MHCRHNLLILLLATMVPSSLAAIFPRQDTTTTASSSTTSTSDTSVPTATTTCTSIPPVSKLFLGDRLMENSIADRIVSDVGCCCHVVGTTYCVRDKWRESHDDRTHRDVFSSYSHCFKWSDKFYWRIECDSSRYARLYGWELCAEWDVCSVLSP